MRYICHDNFGSYFVIKLLLLRQKFMLKDITYVHISDFFSCKNWIWSSSIAFIVPCLFPLLLKLIAIDVLLSKVWPRAMKNNIKCHLWVINSLCYDRIYESLRLNGVDVQNKC